MKQQKFINNKLGLVIIKSIKSDLNNKQILEYCWKNLPYGYKPCFK